VTAGFARPSADAVPPPGARLGIRLGLVLALAAAWLAPWAEVQEATTGLTQRETGAGRTGAVALGALVVLWGLSLGSLAARSRRGLMATEAFSAAAVAAVAGALLIASHPWMEGDANRARWLPIFLPLAALAALDGWMRLKSPATGCEITAVRVAAGLLAASALAADGHALPAALAGWVAVAPLAFLLGRSGHAARLTVEGLLLLAALAAGLAPALLRAMGQPAREPIGGLFLTAFAWSVLCAVVVLTAAAAFLAPPEPPAPGAAR
jgi:hypothetical protein